MKKILFLALLFTTIYAQNLEEIINIAIKNNTDIQISKIKVDDKNNDIQNSRSSYLPTVSLSADTTKHNIETSGIKTNGDSQSITLSANQLLYDFDKSTNQIDSATHNFDASKKELESTVSSIVLNVKKAYYDILNKQALIKIANESVKIDELQLYQANEYYKAKVKTKIDVTNAQLQLSNSKIKLLKSQFNLKKSETKLISLLGEENITIDNIKFDMKTILNKTQNDTYNLDKLLNQAKQNRSEILMYNYLLKAVSKSYESSKSDFYPSINLSTSYKDSNSNNIASLETTQSNIGVYLKWEIFSGFRTTAKKREAFNQIKNIKEKLKQQKLNIMQNVTSAYFEVEQNRQSIKLSFLNVDLAQQNLELAQQRYINGLNSLVELNSAKLDFITAKNDFINQYYDYKVSQAVLEYEIGSIYKRLSS